MQKNIKILKELTEILNRREINYQLNIIEDCCTDSEEIILIISTNIPKPYLHFKIKDNGNIIIIVDGTSFVLLKISNFETIIVEIFDFLNKCTDITKTLIDIVQKG